MASVLSIMIGSPPQNGGQAHRQANIIQEFSPAFNPKCAGFTICFGKVKHPPVECGLPDAPDGGPSGTPAPTKRPAPVGRGLAPAGPRFPTMKRRAADSRPYGWARRGRRAPRNDTHAPRRVRPPGRIGWRAVGDAGPNKGHFRFARRGDLWSPVPRGARRPRRAHVPCPATKRRAGTEPRPYRTSNDPFLFVGATCGRPPVREADTAPDEHTP